MVENHLPAREEIDNPFIPNSLRPKVPLIVAHRGASAEAPENTLAAFRRAVSVGAEGVELDLRLSKDGEPMVIHDRSLLRTAGINAAVKDLTARELGEIGVGGWFNDAYPSAARGEFAEERVPTLGQTLAELIDYKGLIYLELKCSDRDIVPLAGAVCEQIRNSPQLPQIIVKSFKLGVLPYFRLMCPEVRTAALFAPKIMRYLRKQRHLVRIAEQFGTGHLSLHYSLATRKLMKRVDKKGLGVTIWTVDNPRWVNRGVKLGLDAIITNDPARLLARRAKILGPART